MPILFNESTDYLFMSNVLNFVFCLVMLLYVRLVLEAKTHSASRRAFKRFVVVVMLCMVADMCSYLFDKQLFPFASVLNHVSMFASVLLTVYVGFSWSFLFDLLFRIKRSKRNQVLNMLLWLSPTIIMLVLLVVNLFTGFLYYVDENNVYHRGSLYVVSFVLQYISFAHTVIRAMLVKTNNSAVPLKCQKMRTAVMMFALVVLGFGCLQALTGGKIAVHCLGLTAGVTIMFVRFLDDQITQDRLTGLNNRYALDAHMTDRVKAHESRSRKHHLYFVLMDVNGFKEINDSYGHLEGDNALKCLASVLHNISLNSEGKIFVARYGGDEFCAVLESSDKNAVQAFINKVNAGIKHQSASLEYRISVCFGYSVYRGGDSTITDWIREADRYLYKNKNNYLGPDELSL